MLPENTAFIFPGQGSQSIGMGQLLCERYPVAREVYALADEWLGFQLSKIAWGGPEETLNDTINTQPALMVHSVAALSVLKELIPELKPSYVAGHSMGELSALVASEALPFRDAFNLVRRRGELMKRAGIVSPGGMAAVLGLDIPTLDEICARASAHGEVVQVANDNCPGQVVISGASAALERAIGLAEGVKARRVVSLPISIAAHSPLMANAQDDFNIAVDSAPIQDPLVPIIGNVNAKPLANAAHIKTDLQAQLTSRVRWTESVQYMISQGINTFIEIGSGNVLGGLIKRIDRQAQVLPLGTPEDFEKLVTTTL